MLFLKNQTSALLSDTHITFPSNCGVYLLDVCMYPENTIPRRERERERERDYNYSLIPH